MCSAPSAEKIIRQMFSASNNSDDDFDAAFRRLYSVSHMYEMLVCVMICCCTMFYII